MSGSGDSDLFRPDPPGIGAWAAEFGEGQHRFWFVPANRVSQLELYDRVAGRLLRELGGHVLLSALWLYPPGDGAQTAPGTETFMLHLVPRGIDRSSDAAPEGEYERLTAAVVSELADPTRPSWPEAATAAF